MPTFILPGSITKLCSILRGVHGLGVDSGELVFGLHADPELETIVKLHEGRLLTVIGDVTVKENRINAVETCTKEFGGIDTFIYCAGVIGPIEKIDKLSIDDMKRSYDVNIFGLVGMV